jgi:hypothetical protein
MDNADQWSICMIGFFPDFKMPYHTINIVVSRVWKHCGLELVMTITSMAT